MESCIVVGEEHQKFARCTGALTLTEFMHWIREAPPISLDEVVLGQGLGRAGQAEARAFVARFVPHVRIREADELAPLRLTHKRKVEHNLITMPRPVGPHSYAMTLELDDSMDRLSDHMTGMHLGGMLLIEGARQATIAALELEYPATGDARWGLAWGALNVQFSSYAFPLPIDIAIEVCEDPSKRTRTQISTLLKIDVRQNEETVCRLQFDVTLVEASLLGRIEAKRARQLAGSRNRVAAPAQTQLPVLEAAPIESGG